MLVLTNIRAELLGGLTMNRILIAAVAGAVVYYVWGMMAWMALPIHTPTILQIPQEAGVTAALKDRNLATGVYVAPFMDPATAMNEGSEFMKNHESGPIYTLLYHKEGLPVMGPKVLLFGFVIDLLAAGIAACMLHGSLGGCCSDNYLARVGFVAGFGFFVALVGHLSYFNWMNFPLGYTLAFCVDVIVGWTLAGLVIAAIVKPGPKAEK